MTIPASVTRINNQAFRTCAQLESAIFQGNAPKMGIGVFRYGSPTYITYFKGGKKGFTTPIWRGQRFRKLPSAVPTAKWLKAPFASWRKEEGRGFLSVCGSRSTLGG